MGLDRGDAPLCLLIHGTGAATHSWRDVMPMLARDWRVIAFDLPGHGFTRAKRAQPVSLPAMSQSIGALLDTLGEVPDLIVGHSAGAAIALEIVAQRGWECPVVGLNPALLPFPGLAARLFPSLAKMLFTNPFVARIFARMARYPGEVGRFLGKSTGSRIDRAGIEYYRRLLSHAGHCDGAIRMMASWQLDAFKQRLPQVAVPVLLVHGAKDKQLRADRSPKRRG